MYNMVCVKIIDARPPPTDFFLMTMLTQKFEVMRTTLNQYDKHTTLQSWGNIGEACKTYSKSNDNNFSMIIFNKDIAQTQARCYYFIKNTIKTGHGYA